MNKTALALLVALLILAVSVGYLVFKLSSESTMPKEITQTQENVLDFPTVESTQEQKEQHHQLVIDLAESTDTIEINDCQPTPLVTKVKNANVLKFKNNDKFEHNIFFDVNHVYLLKPAETLEVKVDFNEKLGDLGFSCDGSTKPVGVLLLVD